MDASSVLRDGIDNGWREVKEEIEYFWTSFSCKGVPLLVVNGNFGVGVAQPLEAFLEKKSKLW